MFPNDFYEQQALILTGKLRRLYFRRSFLGWLRLGVLLLVIGAVYILLNSEPWLPVLIGFAGLSLFIFVVALDTDNRDSIHNKELLLQINKTELLYQQGSYQSQFDGKCFEPENHAYAADLDVFGKNSLYQYINRCHGENARLLLARDLLNPLPDTAIYETQKAVKEISKKSEWRQQLEAYSMDKPVLAATERRVLQWLHGSIEKGNQSLFAILSYTYPIITITTAVLCILGYIPAGMFLFLLVVYFFVSNAISKTITPVYSLLSKIVSEIDTVSNELSWFENENFDCVLLLDLHKKVKSHKSASASAEIRRLKRILTLFDARLNMLAFAILNTFFLWDVWQLIALRKWKKQNRDAVALWFETITQVEVISTLATLAFNHPEWSFPSISHEHFTLKATKLGHPLIPVAQRVNNSFQIEGTARIELITGSNMAGKSTFLRSIGINMILAFAGAPVCAEQLTVSNTKLISSMRIADNLAENTSTFYAELKKLKSIIESVNNHERLFIILDEILRGTNSLDRHTGSSALIRQLIRQHAVALIATHDIELAKLQLDYPENIDNYHFDVQVSGEELYFDYKLKEGVCKSLNASILMKKIGIDLNT